MISVVIDRSRNGIEALLSLGSDYIILTEKLLKESLTGWTNTALAPKLLIGGYHLIIDTGLTSSTSSRAYQSKVEKILYYILSQNRKFSSEFIIVTHDLIYLDLRVRNLVDRIRLSGSDEWIDVLTYISNLDYTQKREVERWERIRNARESRIQRKEEESRFKFITDWIKSQPDIYN